MESWLSNQVEEIFKGNPLSSLLGIEITTLADRQVTLTMPVSDAIHTNVYGLIHGGVLFTLADSAMGIVGLTTGNIVVTNDVSIRFISNAKMGNTLNALGRIVHKGQDMVVAEAEIRDRRQRLLAKAEGSYFIRSPIRMC